MQHQKHGVKKMRDLYNALHERFGIVSKVGSPIEQLFFELTKTK